MSPFAHPLNFVVAVAWVAGLLIVGTRYLQSRHDDRGVRLRLAGGMVSSGFVLVFAIPAIPWLLPATALIRCPPGHDTMVITGSIPMCTGVDGGFVVFEFDFLFTMWILAATIVLAYVGVLTLLRAVLAARLMRHTAVPRLAAGLGLGVVVVLFAALPRVILPVAWPANVLNNLREVGSWRIIEPTLINAVNSDVTNTDNLARLLDTSSHIDVRGTGNKTPLITAAEHGGAANVALLLDRGADPNLADVDGRTALDYARAQVDSGNVEFEELVERMTVRR